MKFTISVKDANLSDSLATAIKNEVNDELDKLDLDPVDREELFDEKFEDAYESLNKWVRHSEYLTVEVDTDNDTMTLVKYGM